MRTLALINQKGGCGKTTCSINLAACMAHLDQRTLLVDMDPQGHCAVGLAVPDAQVEKSIYDILRNPGGSQTIKDITWQIATNFDLVPSNISLAALESELHDVAGRQDRLADALSRVANDYDYCIIDCPPNVGLLTFNAMRACSEVVIPVETGYFSLARADQAVGTGGRPAQAVPPGNPGPRAGHAVRHSHQAGPRGAGRAQGAVR